LSLSVSLSLSLSLSISLSLSVSLCFLLPCLSNYASAHDVVALKQADSGKAGRQANRQTDKQTGSSWSDTQKLTTLMLENERSRLDTLLRFLVITFTIIVIITMILS